MVVKNNKVPFEQVEGSTVFGVNIPRNQPETAQVAVPKGTTISLQKAHSMLSHVSMETTRTTMQHWGWKTDGDLTFCKDCTIGKAKQKAVKKTTSTHATKPRERLFVGLFRLTPRCLPLIVTFKINPICQYTSLS